MRCHSNAFPFEIKNLLPHEILEGLASRVEAVYSNQIFNHGGQLVELERGCLKPITVPRMAALMPRAVHFLHADDDGEDARAVAVGREWAERLVHGPELFDPLVGVRTTPFFRPDGSVVVEPGYDPPTQVYLHWEGPAPDPSQMTEEHIKQALGMLLSFSFSTKSDYLGALAFFVQPVLQLAFDGPAPEFVVNSRAKDSGKSYLVDVWGRLHLGHPPRSVPAGATPSETMYQLHGELASGRMVIYADNHPSGTVVGGAERNRLLTAPGPVSVRPVGHSTVLVEPRLFTWVTTMNRYDIDDEHARRTVPIGLEPRTTAFPYPNLLGSVQAHRADFVACLLALVQRWQAAGRPAPSRKLSSFAGWSEWVGGVVCFALPDLAEAWLADASRPVPAAEREWALFFETWPLGEEGPQDLRPSEILKLINASDLQALREMIGSGTPASQAIRLGRALGELAESRRRCGSYVLGRKSSGNNKTFRPVKADG